MVEVSRDGRRIYFTNSLYVPWDEQFYPDGIRGWMVKLDAKPEGGIDFDPRFFLDFGELRRTRCVWKAATLRRTRTATRERGRVVGAGRRCCCSAPITASTRAWAGCLPSRSACRSGAARRRLVAACPSHWATRWPSPRRSALPAVLGLVVPLGRLRLIAAVALLAFGGYRLFRHRHPSGGGMRVGFRDLTIWSFLMASAHGAGLMVLPILFGVVRERARGPRGRCGKLDVSVARGRRAYRRLPCDHHPRRGDRLRKESAWRCFDVRG